MKKTSIEKLNEELALMGIGEIKDLDPCVERTKYYAHKNEDNWSDADWVKLLKELETRYFHNFHGYLYKEYQHLLFEKTNDKVYWNYNEETGIYDELAFPEVRSIIIEMLIKEGFSAKANENSAKAVLNKFKSVYSQQGVVYSAFDVDGDWFHAKNGWLNIYTEEFELHTPERLSRRVSSVDYVKGAECPQYDHFLDEKLKLSKDKIRVLDQYSGLILTTDMQYSQMLTLISDPGCGKSTLLDVWSYVLGDMAVTMELEEFNDANAFYKEELASKTLAWFDETDVKKSELSAKLGTLITGKLISFERKGIQGRVKIPNTVKCVLTANDMPPRAQKGAFRRILKVQITRRSFKDEGDLDREFYTKVLHEGSGILNRMLIGLRDLKKMRGFTMIEGAEEDMEDYMQASDPVSEFMHTHFDYDYDANPVSLYDLTNAYKHWKEGDTYAKSLTPRSFKRLVDSMLTTKLRDVNSKKTRSGIVFLGLKLQKDYQWNKLNTKIETVESNTF